LTSDRKASTMKLKQLESALSNLDPSFPKPQIRLEQYPTSAHLAAAVALKAYEKGDIFVNSTGSQNCVPDDNIQEIDKNQSNVDTEGRSSQICDLGCGTGMLLMAFSLVLNYYAEQDYNSDDDCNDDIEERNQVENIQPHGQVIGIDVDENALKCAEENKNILLEMEYLEENVPVINFIHAELQYEAPLKEEQHMSSRGRCRGRGPKQSRGHVGKSKRKHHQRKHQSKIPQSLPYSTTFHTYNDGLPFPSHSFDTVITNPPFGTKHNEGIDIAFLAAACRLSRKSVYSFHKSSTRNYLINIIEKEWNNSELLPKGIKLGIEVVAQMKFEIPNMYKFHKEKSVDVDVDLIRVYYLESPTYVSKPEIETISEKENEGNEEEE